MADEATVTTKGMDVDSDDAKDEKKSDTKKDDTKPSGGDSDDENLTNEEEAVVVPPTSDIEEKVALIVSEASSGADLSSVLEKLLYLEKKQRQGEHEANTSFICLAMLDLVKERGDWQLTVEQILVLSRRRSQFRRVIRRMVQHAMAWLDAGDMAQSDRLALLTALITVTEGKIFVEVERARLTRKLSEMAEKEDGDVAKACDILQELQIETFGSMRKREKCDFLLEQFRLNLAKKDFIRAGIVRNKITVRIMKNLYELEVKYWNLSLILFYHHERQFLELSKAYLKLLALLKTDEEKIFALRNGVMALVLAEAGNERQDMLFKVLSDTAHKKLLEGLPVYRQLLTLLTTKELMEWPLSADMMAKVTSFKFVGVVDNEQSFLMDRLKERVVQHNIGVVAGYYSRISTKRLASFLAVDERGAEDYVSRMVTEGQVFARINRLDGVIRFKKKERENEVLNAWKADTDKLLELVDLTCHQIHKEMVVHKAKGKGKKARK